MEPFWVEINADDPWSSSNSSSFSSLDENKTTEYLDFLSNSKQLERITGKI